MKSPKQDSKEQQQRRRAKSAIPSNKQKSTNKTVTLSIIEKKKQHFKHNASMLRQYQKAMKKEGFHAGQGASRKRTTTDNSTSSPPSVPQPKTPSIPQPKDDKITYNNFELAKQKKQKMNPFSKSIQLAEEKKKQKQELVESHKKREVDIDQKLDQRKKTSRLLNHRTRKGQPFMDNVMSVLLNKIQEKHSSK